MSTRQVRCPECSSSLVKIVKVHDPETTHMKSHATLKCSSCGHEWEGTITSESHKRGRQQGRYI